MKIAAQLISGLDFENIRTLQNGKNIILKMGEETLELTSEDILIQRQEKEGLLVETDNLLTVALDTELSENLIQEGFAREFIKPIVH